MYALWFGSPYWPHYYFPNWHLIKWCPSKAGSVWGYIKSCMTCIWYNESVKLVIVPRGQAWQSVLPHNTNHALSHKLSTISYLQKSSTLCMLNWGASCMMWNLEKNQGKIWLESTICIMHLPPSPWACSWWGVCSIYHWTHGNSQEIEGARIGCIEWSHKYSALDYKLMLDLMFGGFSLVRVYKLVGTQFSG